MIFDNLIGFFSSDMAIDLGTANTLVLVRDKGIVINEPSVVTVVKDKYGGGRPKILAVGKEAKDMVGKTPLSIEAIRPMKEGVIADFEMTEKMIRYFIEKTHRRKNFLRPRVVISVPQGLTPVERKAVRESALSAGAREVYLVQEPMAAAIGANLPIQEPKGNLIVDIGGGTTEIGVISLGDIVVPKSIRVGGDKLDMAVVNWVKQHRGLVIGERTAEEVKIAIGSAYPLDKELSISVKGRDQITGLLKRVPLTSEDVREAMQDSLDEIANALRFVLEALPPDLAGDVVENGIVISGGGALIRGIDKYISEAVKLPTYIADEPLLCVARGTGRILEDIKLLQQLTNEE